MTSVNEPTKVSSIKALYLGATTEHEKIAAYKKLELMCKKHNLQIEDVLSTDEKRFNRQIRYYSDEERKLIVQIAVMFGLDVTTYVKFSKHMILVQVTLSEWIEFSDYYEFYLTKMRKEFLMFRKAFFAAFASKNNLFPPNAEDDSDDEPKEPKKRDFDVNLALSMMQSLEAESPLVKIGTEFVIGKTTAKK